MVHPIVQVAADLVPLIWESRHDTEENRRLAAPVVDRLRADGFARMSLAREYAGLEVPLVDTLKAYELLASAEASVAWIVWNCSLVTLVSRYMTPKLRNDVFNDSGFLFAQSTRPTGRATQTGHGFMVNGTWSLVSGCELADWLFLTCQVHDKSGSLILENGMPKTAFMSIPKTECRIIDTWHSGGLRGTGSHDLELRDVEVPGYRAFDFSEVHEIDSAIARAPAFCILQCLFAAQTLGLGQKALDTVIEMARSNITPGPMPDLRDRADARTGVARHKFALAAARNNLYLQVDALWDQIVAGNAPTLVEISNIYGASMHAISISTKTVDCMHALGGTKALYTDSPLERHHRDLHAMLRHIVAQKMWLEDVGSVMFDLPPEIPIYAL